ncbi:MAG: NusG domain II-containing protein [Christensenellales bacterium]
MNTARAEQIKVQKAFIKWDIIVYVLLFVIIISLFWVFRLNADHSFLTGLEVYYEDKTAGEVLIFSYDYTSDEYRIHELFKDKIQVESTPDGYTVKILYGDSGYNLLHILHSGEAFISDANCSSRKDCVGFEHITKGNMVIICVPHHLKILGIGSPGDMPEDNPMIG